MIKDTPGKNGSRKLNRVYNVSIQDYIFWAFLAIENIITKVVLTVSLREIVTSLV